MTCRLREAASRFFRGPHRFSFSGRSSGFSGSVLVRVEADGGPWCVRGWPPGFDEGRLRFVHRALLHSRAAGFSGVPKLATTHEGETVLDLGGRLFDAQEWWRAKPLSNPTTHTPPTPNVVYPLRPSMLSSLTAAVARFHRSTADLAPEHEAQGRSVQSIFTEVAREVEAHYDALLAGVSDRAANEARRVALRWLELLPAVVASSEACLRRHPAGAVRASTLCHGDLWASHAHFDGPNFVGFADFEGLSFGSPAVDLAQVILHFNGWTSCNAVLRTYQDIHPLAEEDQAVLPAVVALDLASEGTWALGRLYGEVDRLAPAESMVHERTLSALLGSLEMVLAELED